MRRLIIRNVGPVKSVDVQLNKVNVFIGPQSSGKSTIAKVLSTCSWVEKEVATTMNDSFVADTDAFIALMSDFHKMTKYFDDASEILFETEVVRIALKGKEFSLQLKDRIEHINGKTYEIPLGSASSGLQSVVSQPPSGNDHSQPLYPLCPQQLPAGRLSPCPSTATRCLSAHSCCRRTS